MPSAVRAITRIQDADDFSGSLTDTYIPAWSNSQQKFVMTAQPTTSPGGSSGYVQYNNAGAFGASGVYWDSANSRVGIGTASPSQKLSVSGKIRIEGTSQGIAFDNWGIFDKDTSWLYLRNQGDSDYGNLVSGKLAAITGFVVGNSSYTTVAPPANGAIIQGNVGIGTTSPGQKLDVNGSVNVATALISPDIRPASNAVNSTGFSNASGTRVLSVDTTNSRVGIGTTSPTGKLEISSASSVVVRYSGSSATDYRNEYYRNGSRIGLFSWDTGLFGLEADSANSVAIRFVTGGSERLRINSSGNVGIGTTSPNNKLDVAGTVQMDDLRIDVTPTLETVTATHTVTFSANGTNYKFLCVPA